VEEELIQYIIVNKDLEMSPGKIAAQVGHVCTICAVEDNLNPKFIQWFNINQKKVILHAHEKDILQLIYQGFGYYIHDLGLTEIPAGSLTALSLGIMTRLEAEPFVKRLQLLK
jgi:PTH2 family peptidyl-tRNA hydrolase